MTIFSFGDLTQGNPGAGVTIGPDMTVSGATATAPSGIGVRVGTAFGSAFKGLQVADRAGYPYYGYGQIALESFARTGVNSTSTFSFFGLIPGSSYEIKLIGTSGNATRDTRFTLPSGTYDYDAIVNTSNPPTAPIVTTEVADGSGEILVSVEKTPTGEFYGFLNTGEINLVASGPTITNINTTNEVTPGETATLTGTNLTNATGINIGSVSQTGFTVVNDTTVTFTGTRGGNPYNKDLTATLLSLDGDATITVQQVPEAGTFAVTASSPNTTDDASLWANTVDTSTGDPVTAVNGNQFWVNSTIPGLAIDPTGAITANETGKFTGQFWRASEGVWGSNQTVSFTLPEVVTSIFSRKLRRSNKSALNKSLRTKL